MGIALTQAYVDTNAGRIAFGAITGNFQTLLATEGSVRKLIITNSLDTEMIISLNGGTNNWIYLPALNNLMIDFDPSTHFWGTISVKHNGAAPTVGAISAGIIKGQ